MKIKSQIKINMDENSRTKIGEFVYFEDVLLECKEPYRYCSRCYFNAKDRCVSPLKRCFSCSYPNKIYVKA